MSNYDVQVVLKSSTNLPENNVVNTLHFEVNAPDTLGGVSDSIWAAYEAFTPILGGVNGGTIKWYPPGSNPAGPTFTKDYVFAGTPPQSGPAEVAICLSYASVDNPEAATPRRRGRIYLGPMRAASFAGPRPDATIRDYVLDFGEAIGSVGTASNTTWLMYSTVDDEYVKIESIWCDDAWDTQRRRGLSPTLRDTRDVQ